MLRTPIQIRFSDVDRYGHVNNNAYFAYYDLGKVEYLTQVLGIAPGAAEIAPIIANINADFIEPIYHGDEIVIETSVSHLGHKSFTLLQRAIKVSTGATVCQCATVMVCVNIKEGASVEIPDDFRRAIQAHEGLAS